MREIVEPEPLSRVVGASAPQRTDQRQPVTDPENELFAQFAAGDSAAFDVLFRRYSKSVYRLCVQIIGVPAQAEELAQEVFVKAHQAAPRWRASGSFRSWPQRIA